MIELGQENTSAKWIKNNQSESEVAQSCLTLCDPIDCSLPGSSVHGIFRAIVLEWIAISFSRDLPDPGIELGCPALQADTLPSEPHFANAPNMGAPQYIRQMLTRMKGEINSNTIIVGDFNTPLTSMDRSTEQKISKETQI